MSYLTQLEKEIEELRRLKKRIIEDMGIDISERWLPHLKALFPKDKDLEVENWQETDSEKFKEKCIQKIQILINEKMKELKEEENTMIRRQLDLIQREIRTFKKRRVDYERGY